MKNTPTGVLCAGFATVRPLLLLKNNGPFQTVKHRADYQLQRNVEEEEANVSDKAQRSPLATARQFPPVQRFGAKTGRYIQKQCNCATSSAFSILNVRI